MGDLIYQGIKIPEYMLDPPGSVQGNWVDTAGVKKEDKPRPKQQAHVVTATVVVPPPPLTTGANFNLFCEALKKKLGAGCTDFNAVVEGTLQQAGRVGVSTAATPVSSAASPAFHFRHCHITWDDKASP